MSEKIPNKENDKLLHDLITIKIPRMAAGSVKTHLIDYCGDNALTYDAKAHACRLVVAIDDAERLTPVPKKSDEEV